MNFTLKEVFHPHFYSVMASPGRERSWKGRLAGSRARWIQQGTMIMKLMGILVIGMVTMITKHEGKMKFSNRTVNKWHF